MAYLRVHSRANSLYFSLSVLYNLAISGTSGSSGFGSHSKEHIDSNTESKKTFLHATACLTKRAIVYFNLSTLRYSECRGPLRS